MEAEAFENVKPQIGRCGIWCGSCAIGNRTLRTLGKRCERIIKGYGVNEWGAKDFDGKEFMKGLTSIQALLPCQGCLKGGGNDECAVRPCAVERRQHDCTECSERKTCKNLEALLKVRTGALAAGMLARSENDKTSQRELIRNWTTDIKTKCLQCGA